MAIHKAHSFKNIDNNGGAAFNMGRGSENISNVIKSDKKSYKASAHVSKIDLDKSGINKPLIRKDKNSISSIFTGGSEKHLRRSVNSVVIDLAGTKDLLLIDSPYKRTVDVPFPDDEVNSQNFTTQADGCQEPGQRAKVILLGPKTGNVRPSSWFKSNVVDFAPGCGCYTDLSYGLLDVIPISILVDGIWGPIGRSKALKKVKEILFDLDAGWASAKALNYATDSSGNIIKGAVKGNIDKATKYTAYLQNLSKDPKFFDNWAYGKIDSPKQLNAFLVSQGDDTFDPIPQVIKEFRDESAGLADDVAREITSGATVNDFLEAKLAEKTRIIVKDKQGQIHNRQVPYYDSETIINFLDSPVYLTRDYMDMAKSMHNFGNLILSYTRQGKTSATFAGRVNQYLAGIIPKNLWDPRDLPDLFERAMTLQFRIVKQGNPNIQTTATVSITELGLLINQELTDNMVTDKLWLQSFYNEIAVNLTAAMDKYNFDANMTGAIKFTGDDLISSLNLIESDINSGVLSNELMRRIRALNTEYVKALIQGIKVQIKKAKKVWNDNINNASKTLQTLTGLEPYLDTSQNKLKKQIEYTALDEWRAAGLLAAGETFVWFSALVSYLGLAAFGLVRQKYCGGFLNMIATLGYALGAGTTYDDSKLNPSTCDCDCQKGFDKCPADPSSESWFSTPAWVFAGWNNLIPAVPKTDELGSCYRECCDSQTAYTNPITFTCGCACLGDLTFGTPFTGGDPESTFFPSSECDCLQPSFFGLQKGKCVNQVEDHRKKALGQTWDASSCSYICPNNTDGKQIARAPNGYAIPTIVTYTDYYGDSQVENSLCDGTCVDPGVCTDGYAFNNDIAICGCQKICGENTVALRWTQSGAGPNQWTQLYHDCDSWLQVPNYPVSAGATDIYDGSPANYQYGTVICEPCQSSSYVQNIDNQDMIP